MGRITSLRDLIGVIKDKASVSKAALVSKPSTLSLHLAVLRATSHSLSTPPENSLSTLLTLGDSSRATASTLITALISRLRNTTSASVALKCLITTHVVITRGPFILQDQISVAPFTHGHNNLKLSNFQDSSTSATWTLSSWVRFYARYIESNLSTSKTLGFFITTIQGTEIVLTYTAIDLIKEVDSLVNLLEEMCKVPISLFMEDNTLLYEIMGLLTNDYLSVTNYILVRLNELRVRLSYMSFGELVELMSFLKRLEDVKERLSVVFSVDKASIDMLWGLIGEMKEKVEKVEVYREGGMIVKKLGRDGKGCESARFGDRHLNASDSVQFSSGRLGLNKLSFKILDAV